MAEDSWKLGQVYEQRGDIVCAVELMEVAVAYEQEFSHPDAGKHAERVAALRAQLAAGQ